MRSSNLLANTFCGFATLFCLSTIGVPSFTKPALNQPANAITPAGAQPQACFGSIPLQSFGSEEQRSCPANHALYWVSGDGGKHSDGSTVNVGATCCPLPSNDILIEEHVFEPAECPANYVATGAAREKCQGSSCRVALRCTKINTARYQLGAETPSLYWGNGYSGWRGSKRIDWEEIPAALRFAVGREQNSERAVDGCVGYPWGSLYTKKTSKHCGGNYFRQLQFTGAPGDPQAGVPVKMLAECSAIANPHDPAQARCDAAPSENLG